MRRRRRRACVPDPVPGCRRGAADGRSEAHMRDLCAMRRICVVFNATLSIVGQWVDPSWPRLLSRPPMSSPQHGGHLRHHASQPWRWRSLKPSSAEAINFAEWPSLLEVRMRSPRPSALLTEIEKTLGVARAYHSILRQLSEVR